MITERHNLECSMIFKAIISKTGSLGYCFVCMDVGSSERLAMQNLQIPDLAATRTIPRWLFPPRFSDKNNNFTSSRPDAVLVAPCTGSNERLTMQNLQIPETTESGIVPKWLFPPRFSAKDRFTSSRPDLVQVTPTAAKTQKQQINVGSGFFVVAGGN